MYRQLRALGVALFGIGFIWSIGHPAGAAQAAAAATTGNAKASASVTATFKDRDPEAGEIGGIFYWNTTGAEPAQGYEAYLVDNKGKRYGKALGRYVEERQSIVIPEGTKVTGKAAALGLFNAADRSKSAAAPIATAKLLDEPAYRVGELTYKDANPGAGAWASIAWSDPADGTAYDGYQIEYPGGTEKLAKSASGRYKLPLQNLDILGEVTVVPYRKGGVFDYTASARVQTYDDIRDEAPSWIDSENVNSASAPVSDIHFKPVLSGGKTRVSGELSWYDAKSSTTVSYVVYGADEAGKPIQSLVDVTNDYPFDGRAISVTLPEFKLEGVANINVVAIRDEGQSAAASIPVGGDPDPLFVDTDNAKGEIGGTVYVMPRFPDYGATLHFVDEWQQPVGDTLDTVMGENRYFEIPSGTAIPEGAWKLAIYDNGGLEGSEFEKPPQYIGFEDRFEEK
ncbi:hypothetical protein [Cohnella sp. GbtcB17]|uniref:hypothetical protein n=1 Tax=Cohnella sp. GbtcB17 TaxID=2824762 RepID=UPI001C30F82C|nr:hypothetical protein [Cohnella sp. GbtcB17]